MGMIDHESVKFFASNEIFADMFNYAFWKRGVPNRVDPKDLYEMDGRQIIDVVNGKYVHRFQRERDVVRLWRLTAGDETIEIPLILGLELQDYIHYALPVKVMAYDMLTYADQVRKVSNSKAQVELTDKEDIVITDPNEFLSGFPKGGILIPPITITVYLGNEHWDAPLSLREMWSPSLSLVPELRDKMMQDYKAFFVNINDISDPEFQQFKTELSHVLLFAKNRKNMNALVDHTKQYHVISLSNDAFDFLRVHGF